MTETCEGVIIAHGDATTGYSLYVQSGHLVHDMNIGGEHVIVRSGTPISPGKRRLGVRVSRIGCGARPTENPKPINELTLLIDGAPAGSIRSRLGFLNQISWTGLDIGRDRGSPVSHYMSPFAFTGKLIKVTVTMDDDQILDGDGIGRAELARD
jgi:arylsulfatase